MRMVKHFLNLLLTLCLGLGSVSFAWANDITVMSGTLSVRTSSPQGLYLDVNVEFDLPRSVQDALNRGIPLYFVTEFSIQQQRWYWVNKPLIEASLMTRLSYSPLTRQYRLSRGGLSQSFDSLSETLAILKSLHGWRISEDTHIENPEDCVAEVRVRLDTNQLPLPMQVTIGENDWDLTSDWYVVDFDRSITHPLEDGKQ
ncbi:DUF4390 domain-containing protein [Parasutterella secunda]|uniref:DUF4390 domain-containing protein n=1 Tax=Parasutterella secunda TaxID=626947 RepID=A0ABS2GSM6_9BURK|nr:DUF4390 domain-containing protein [Parasutterella secunda]MBM6927757.1 DUF4390 domain-containing protein [Parasutterella secunda]